jgi:hypothetical protein
VEPTTGDRCFLEWPSLNAELFPRCIDAFAQAFPDRRHRLVLDNRGAQTTPRRHLPPNVRLVFLPPYGPALNPRERVWRALKDDMAWPPCAELKAQPDSRSDLLRAYEPAPLPSRTGSPSLVEAVHALCI